MSKEIKMSDVFDGDVRHFGGGSIGDDRCDEFAMAQFEDSTEAEYSCHAINNHDTLTEQVEQLREALETIYVSIDDDLNCCLDEERLISIGHLLDVTK